MSLETLKSESDFLRGSLVHDLAQDSSGIGDDSAQILKFHGIYQQDDRDLRQGRDRDYVFMVRASLPGGVLSAEQYLVSDGLADQVGDGTLRITTRQGLQWHHVRKGSLRPLIETLNRSLVTTLGACGDVVRNVVACPAPETGNTKLQLSRWAQRIAERFRPRTRAYYEIWIDGARTVSAESDAAETVEPLYGSTYLPRKFKIGIARPGDNCVDVHTHDVGLVPVVEGGSIEGVTVLAGGGQGRSHNRPDTYPRLAEALTTVPPAQAVDVVEAIVKIQRDLGEREDRKQARLKYLIDRWGDERFRAEVEERLGWDLPEPFVIGAMGHSDHFGWHRTDTSWFCGVHIENGRIADTPHRQLRTGLRTVVQRYRPEVRLTPNQNALLVGISADDRAVIDQILSDHGVVPAHEVRPVIRNSMACVALPTCGLALTDAERALPAVIRDISGVLDSLGLGDDGIGVRMTGCPNGCARPYSTEIGLVGHRRGRYDIHLGGARDGTRLNELFVESVPAESLGETLRPLFSAYAGERLAGETFGGYLNRVGLDRFQSDGSRSAS